LKGGARRAALTLALACAGCTGPQSALDPRGDQAQHLLNLILFIVVACAIVWLLVVGVLAVAMSRRRDGGLEPREPGPATERRLTIAVGSAVIATGLVVTVFTIASYRTTRALDTSGSDALTIEVRGYQWWWNVIYHDPRSHRPLSSANEIHIPAGRDVRLLLDAGDVIHSFWVPNLAGKQDLIPGRGNTITINAHQPGIYRGQCAEFCGVQHAHMAFLVIAQTPEDFEAWMAAQSRDAAAPADPEQDRGRQVFLAKPCAACHTIRGTPAAGTTGPDLTHVASRRTIGAGLFDTTRGSLAAWIADPQTLKPGNNMPMVPLSADELQAVSAYLANLR
jgi:cytochrome c oxidase subunit 2